MDCNSLTKFMFCNKAVSALSKLWPFTLDRNTLCMHYTRSSSCLSQWPPTRQWPFFANWIDLAKFINDSYKESKSYWPENIHIVQSISAPKIRSGKSEKTPYFLRQISNSESSSSKLFTKIVWSISHSSIWKLNVDSSVSKVVFRKRKGKLG